MNILSHNHSYNFKLPHFSWWLHLSWHSFHHLDDHFLMNIFGVVLMFWLLSIFQCDLRFWVKYPVLHHVFPTSSWLCWSHIPSTRLPLTTGWWWCSVGVVAAPSHFMSQRNHLIWNPPIILREKLDNIVKKKVKPFVPRLCQALGCGFRLLCLENCKRWRTELRIEVTLWNTQATAPTS